MEILSSLWQFFFEIWVVDNASEDNSGFGLVPGEGKQTLPFAPRHDDGGESFQALHRQVHARSSLTLALSSERSADLIM